MLPIPGGTAPVLLKHKNAAGDRRAASVRCCCRLRVNAPGPVMTNAPPPLMLPLRVSLAALLNCSVPPAIVVGPV